MADQSLLTNIVLMKQPYSKKAYDTGDLTTYILVGSVLVTVILGALKIVFM